MKPAGAVAVAASGGRDSTALLHATARAASALGLEVHALHVHHGLVAEADAWLQQVQTQCRRWRAAGLPLHFHAQRLNSQPGAGDSVEAWARRERYRALAAMAQAAGCSLV
ncbi:MAG: ATP-binding protein, partial [Rubrivivax sp.]